MAHIGIFLDRDGTINEELDFLASPKKLRLIPRSADAIREANSMHARVFIITNQSGIARGILTEQQLSKIHRTLVLKLEGHNAHIDAIYYCPHHPDFGDPPYRVDCTCRKPNTGMLAQAAKDFDIDLKRSFVIGDRLIDIQTGQSIGATSILVLTGYGKQELQLCQQANVSVDHVADDLYDAVQHVKCVVQLEQPTPS